MDLAHLAHVELLTPKLEESLKFFVNVFGMTESGREGDSVYLRAYDDYERHTLKLTASKLPGMGHMAFRATSPEALERRVAIIEATGLGKGWTDGDLGHGRAPEGPETAGPEPDRAAQRRESAAREGREKLTPDDQRCGAPPD